jgi:hypothetical protein
MTGGEARPEVGGREKVTRRVSEEKIRRDF